MRSDGRWNAGSHFKAEGVEIGGTVKIDVADFILNFGLDFVKSDFSIKRGKGSLNLSHILSI